MLESPRIDMRAHIKKGIHSKLIAGDGKENNSNWICGKKK